MNTHTHTHTHAHIDTLTHISTHIPHTHTHTHKYTRKHTHTQTHTSTHKYTRTQWNPVCMCVCWVRQLTLACCGVQCSTLGLFLFSLSCRGMGWWDGWGVNLATESSLGRSCENPKGGCSHQTRQDRTTAPSLNVFVHLNILNNLKH